MSAPSRLIGIALLLAGGLPLAAEEAEQASVDYLRDIKPLLATKCSACHGAVKQQSELRLDTAALAKKGGLSGPAVVAAKPEESLIVARVSAPDPAERMPPEGEGEPLDEEQIALVRAWIVAGAPAPEESIPPGPRDHWAYQPPERPAVPQIKLPGWTRNEIDVFIASAREQRDLAPAAPATKQILLRRVYLDLIGLPPTRDELHAFLADASPNAYENVVERLLASERYGERWGRHWMDVWRYSDWSGYGNQIRNSQKHIWRWRDWIIESLNADKGYDRMVLEMLAADELAPADADALRATGFLARHWYKFNRNTWLDGTIEHTAKAFLGVTMNCAKCHDHKYDPIAQEDYYRFRAIFEPYDVRMDRVPGEPDLEKNGLPRVQDMNASAATYLFERGNEKHPDKEHPLSPGLPEIFGDAWQTEEVALPVESFYPSLRDWVVQETREAAATRVTEAKTSLEKAQTNGDARAKDLAAKQFAAAEANAAAVEARIAADRAKYGLDAGADVKQRALAAGTAEAKLNALNAEVAVLAAEAKLSSAQTAANEMPDDKKAKDAAAAAEKELAAAQKTLEANQKAAESATEKYTPLGKEYPRTSTGRRTALARWIVDRDNPLTARVAVNHVWLRHFGSPLVENVFDLGLRSDRPQHADLLDWLAVELMENGWSMKHLHRLMVTSATYRMSSTAAAAPAGNVAADPDNHLYWRMNSRRLEAEAVRDSVLHVAGHLDLAMGGPEIDHQQGQTSRRRSIYFRHAYEKQMKFLELFDAASVNECYRRTESIIPQQALALANSAISLSSARLLARKLNEAVSSESGEAEDATAAFVTAAFEQVLSRSPSSEELDECRRFLSEQSKLLSDKGKLTAFSGGAAAAVGPADDPALRARENLVHVLCNHSDFVTIR